MSNDFEAIKLFPTVIYKTSSLEQIDAVRAAGIESLKPEIGLNELYPSLMSADLTQDERVFTFAKHVIQTAYNILVAQGYNMEGKQTVFQYMWMQEHNKSSGMEQHIHNNGAQLVGFYFLDTPDNCCKLVLHDPRTGKVQLDMPQADPSTVQICSEHVWMQPKAGDLIFTNAWLPHSFSRHGSDEPLRFVHINIAVVDVPQQVCEAPIII